jgi:hypothetical protein
MDDEYKLINSPLSRKLTRDGMTIEVLIYRGEYETGWHLEVVDPDGTSTVWHDPFSSQRTALNEVYRIIAAEGMATFTLDPNRRTH